MDWITVYITGKPGFKKEVLENLDKARFPHLPGAPENDSLCLVWIDEHASLRDFKMAIGSKIIFKYRLKFFPSLEKYYESLKNDREISFSPQEKALISEMLIRERPKRVYRHSA